MTARAIYSPLDRPVFFHMPLFILATVDTDLGSNELLYRHIVELYNGIWLLLEAHWFKKIPEKSN